MSRGEMEESGGLRGELREGTEASDECEGRGTDGLLLEEGKLPPTGYGVRAERKEVSVFTFRERYFTKNNMGLLPLGVRRVERFSPGMTCRSVTLMRRHHRGRRTREGEAPPVQ